MNRNEPASEGSTAGAVALPSAAAMTRMDPELRRAKLALAVQQEVVAGGRVESQTEFTAIVRYEQSVNHILHLLLTLITFGFWVFIWLLIAVAATSNRKTVMLTVDEYGQGVRQVVK